MYLALPEFMVGLANMTSSKITLSGKEIEVFDDIFSGAELLKFHTYAQNCFYKVERSSTGLIEDRSLATLKSSLSFKDALALGLISSPNFKPLVELAKQKEVRLARSYINICTSDDLFPYHTDSNFESDLTMLYFMNTKWEPMWEGETHFASENMRDIRHSCSFISGRLAVFNPTIPHKSSQPSRAAQGFRYTYALKFISLHENNENLANWNNAIDLYEFFNY